MFKTILSEILQINKIKLTTNIFNYVNNNNKQLARPLSTCYNLLTSKFNSNNQSSIIITTKKNFSITSCNNGLMEFFDDPKNWGQNRIIHGREWKLDELRLKSNVDLHKLWFILLKERNMLLTMQETYNKNNETFPNPERIAKVDISMEHILHVVKERDISYNLLETGESKQIIPYKRFNSLGYLQNYRQKEYYLPWYLNTTWKLRYHYKKLPFWSKWFRTMLNVNVERRRKRKIKMIENRIEKLRIKYPNLEDETFWREYFETKYRLKPIQKYSDKLRKPKVDDIPEKFKEKSSKNKFEIYEEQF